MSLLDTVGQAAGAFTGGNAEAGNHPGLIQAVMNMINKQGGLQGLIALFEQHGGAQMMQSWIGKGENHPISSDQVGTILGNDHISTLASEAGTTPEDAKTGLASLLPMVINQLTPDGTVPEGDMLQKGLGMLGGMFK